MPENLSGNARAFSLIVARISRRFARLPHLFPRDEDFTGSFFRNFSNPIDIDREWNEKIWIFGISRDSMGFFFLEIFLIQSISISSENGIKNYLDIWN